MSNALSCFLIDFEARFTLALEEIEDVSLLSTFFVVFFFGFWGRGRFDVGLFIDAQIESIDSPMVG